MGRWNVRGWRRTLGVALSMAIATGCLGDDSLSLSRDRGDRRQLHEDLRRRLDVRVQTLEPQTGEFEEEELEPMDFLDFMTDVCGVGDRVGALENSSCQDARDLQRIACAGHLMLEIVQSPAPHELVGFDGQNETTRRVPPQTPATNTTLARYAFAISAVVSGYTLEILADPSGKSSCSETLADTLWEDEDGTEQTWGEFLASMHVEMLHMGREALAEHARLLAAVADAEHSDLGDLRKAGYAALSAPFLSRAVGVHLNVGGADPDGEDTLLLGMDDAVRENGFCPVPRLSADGARALDLIRLAAPDPDLIVSSPAPLDDLVAGTGGVAAADSLAYRLGYLAADAEVLRTGASAADVYDFFGVQRAGWVEALEYLRQEMLAFGRVRVEAPAQPVPDGPTTADLDPPIELWATTRSLPRPPIDAYYAAVARYNPDYTPTSGTTYPAFDVPPPGGSADAFAARGDRFVDGSITGMQHLLDDVGFTYEPARQILGEALGASRGERRSRVRACWFGPGAGLANDEIHYDVHGVLPNAFVVAGSAGIQCAVRGDVEGSPCDLSDYYVASGNLTSPGGATGFEDSRVHSIEASDLAGSSLAQDTVLFFIVEPRDLQSPLLPGNSDPVAGFMLPVPPSGNVAYRYCESVSVVPEIERRVGELLTPSASHCAFSAETCAGIPRDQRLPLENEITSDGDLVESSWRHWLNQAQHAADFADQLGEDLVRSGLDQDLRAEGAIDELQDICGVAINLPSFGAVADLPQDDGPCETDGSCMGQEYSCVSGRCMLDPVRGASIHGGIAESDAARLEACLGGSATVPWATLGSRNLCIWQLEGEWCGGATSTLPCPYFADGTSCDEDKAPEGASVVLVDRALGVFPSPDSEEEIPTLPDPSEFPCALLARVREQTGGPTSGQFAQLRGSPFLTVERIHSLAHRLGWEADVGDFSRVTWDRGVLFRTGNAYSDDPGGQWPCGPDPEPPAGFDELCPTGDETTYVHLHEGSLWCLQDVCGSGSGMHAGSTRARRARVNDLLARAVIAARVLGGRSLADLRVPYYPRVRN